MYIRIKNIENLFDYLNPLFPTLFPNLAFHGIKAQQFSNLKLPARRDVAGNCYTSIGSVLNAFREKTSIASLKDVFSNLKKNVKGNLPLSEGDYCEE